MIVTKMVPMEREISCIAGIVDGTSKVAPKPLPNHPPPSVSAPARSSLGASTSSYAAPTGLTLCPSPGDRSDPSPASRIDDDVQDFPAPQFSGSCPAKRKIKVRQAIEERNSTAPGVPAQGTIGDTHGRPHIGLSFASVITNTAMDQREKAASQARLAHEVQRCNPGGKLKAGHSTAPSGFTDVVIIHEGRSEDKEVEEQFCCCHPADITQAAQRTLNALVCSPPIILQGRWSEMVARTSNFIFRFVGNISPAIIASYQTSLCSHFPAAESACVVPTTGWTWVQLRGMDTTLFDGESGTIYTGSQLLEAFRANPCFNQVDICIKPHWQGNPANFSGPSATVIVAILDPDHSVCQHASREGVCMFGRQIKFVRVGDNPSLVQCSRCHEIGHHYSSLKCKWTVSRCYICRGKHDARDHGFECKNQHKVTGTCNCIPKCILCKGSGHNARDKQCPSRRDFVPPRLPKAAPVVASPTVEDAQKSAVIPFMHPQARPAHRGKGKGRQTVSKHGPPKLPREAPLVEDLCRNDDDLLRAYCFCCPALDIGKYQTLYSLPKGSMSPEITSAKGKTAQDIFAECILRKNKGARFVEKVGSELFHTEDELHWFFTQAAMVAIAPDQLVDYTPADPDAREAWLTNMPSNHEAGWGADEMNQDLRSE
jgi:hypothetical protein